MTTTKYIELELQLGDIIHISNPVNENLNRQTFYIDYIDKSKVYLINTETLNRIKININENGILGDGNITKIEILSRADTPSYARQNGLLPGKWINIFFGGDYPVIIVGQITNLEEDMIEIKTPEKDILYINFDYKGIPENLPIINIEIREKPLLESENNVDDNLEIKDINNDNINDEYEIPQLEEDKKTIKAEELNLNIQVPIKQVKDHLRELIIKADQIVFGDEELGKIVQYVDVSSKIQRYSIETQVSDLLDELLSTIPNTQRTPRVLNNIHIMIERFKQLREHFSIFNQYGIVEGFIRKDFTYKPLKNWLNTFNINLYWILPVVKNIKKIYDNKIEETEDEEIENNDFINININEDLIEINKLFNNYKSNDLPGVNKYASLYDQLLPFFRPFDYINEENQNDIIIEKEVQNNLNVIIDNLENFYSTIFSNSSITTKRFVITKYNLCETKLDTIETNNITKKNTVRVKINDNDLMSIKSIMTLPEPFIRFSKINLPGTNILNSSNLNQIFINYWQILKKKTNVKNVFVETLKDDYELEIHENEFAEHIHNYIINVPQQEMVGMKKEEIYLKYTNAIVPKIRVLFNIMKKYIKGKLTIIDVVSYLEPFLIYTDDLTFNQYKEITDFIDKQISVYNKNMIEFSRIFKMLSSIRHMPLNKSNAFSIIEIISANLRNDVIETGYALTQPEENNSNSEILKKIIMKDSLNLYTATIAYQNLDLMLPKDVSDVFENDKKSTEKKLNENEDKNNCNNIIISKLYTSIEELQNDNNKTIYFDKKYDKTNYGIMEDQKGYYKEVINLTPEKLKEHIITDQMKKNNLTEEQATYLAETLMDGNKKVKDGQYALLYKGYSENIENENDYYIRKNNKWILDNELSKSQLNIDESAILCDLQEKCISIQSNSDIDKCETLKSNELSLQTNLLKNIISEFDTKYKLSKEQFQKEIKAKFDYFMSIMHILSKIEFNGLLKYNNEKYKLSVNISDEIKYNVKSPFSELLDLILSQKDFVKKQQDILKFSNKFTRPHIVGLLQENQHWLYCIKTNVPLLPCFKKELAVAFITSQFEYQNVLEKIKSTNGQLSDDGDWWTDKYTGWAICPGDFDTEEGYDDGFKIVTKSILEEEAGNKIMASNVVKIKYITPESIMINNIINALSIAMGINIEIQKEFIINNVIETIKNTVESENDYKEKIKIAAQKGKNLPSYKEFFNTALLFYTLGMYLIAVQTIIPSIKTRKTHPGCVRSFTGYPFEGSSDLSSLEYLSCVTYDIRESGEPWNVLKKTNVDKVKTKIKSLIDELLLQLPEVQRKFAEKTEYLLSNPTTEIPTDHDISKWTDFLPPLIPFKIKNLANISDTFKQSLVNELKIGSKNQYEKLLVIDSKIIQFSLAIQEKIQQIVKTHKLLLHTSNNEPYLENSCCDSNEDETTTQYFTSRNSEIIEYNQIVQKLENMIDDIRYNTESQLFYSNFNTKLFYPEISNKFDERTIYISFIFYCKFKSLIPIPEELLPISGDKPDNSLINPSDTIDRIIQKLKEDGKNYTNEMFLRLIQLISRKNIINIDLDNPIISSVTKLAKFLEFLNDQNNDDEIIERSLIKLITNAIDTFDIAREENTIEVKNLNNFLIRINEEMKNELISFIKYNSTLSNKKIKNFTKQISNLSIWNFDNSTRNEDIKISDDIMYSIVNFYKSFINNFVNVFPSIILNKINYNFIEIPEYYGYSENHKKKLQEYFSIYFISLQKFYGKEVSILFNILNEIKKIGNNLVQLSQITPCFSNIKNGREILKGVIDDRTSRFLFEYYLLRILITYINLSDENDMINYVKNKEEIDDVYTVEYIEDKETKIDLSIDLRDNTNLQIFTGNKKELKEKVADLLITFIEIMNNEKEEIDITYEDIQDRVFKLKEREKKMVTDRLKSMTDEERDADTIMKITKQGLYSKGLQKGLTVYDKDFYEEEQDLRYNMDMAEKIIRKKNKNASDENIDILVDEYLEQKLVDAEIDNDAYDIEYLGEDFFNGNYDGVSAPEYDDYSDEY